MVGDGPAIGFVTRVLSPALFLVGSGVTERNLDHQSTGPCFGQINEGITQLLFRGASLVRDSRDRDHGLAVRRLDGGGGFARFVDLVGGWVESAETWKVSTRRIP